MPKINVYLPDDLAEAVKDAGVPVSAVCQRALEQAVRRVTSIRSGLTAASSAVNFTRRAWSVVKSAQVSAGAEGLAEAGTEHLLRALVVDGRMAINVLTALEITPHQILAALPSSGGPLSGGPLSGGPLSGGPLSGGPSEPVMSRQLVTAIELAANESSGLGNHYVGSEHLLLGLIGEPEGAAGRVLRSLGADLRVTRRTVAAALAGWGAGFSAHEERAAQPVPSEQLSLAIRAELEPLLARLDRLERPRQVVKDP